MEDRLECGGVVLEGPKPALDHRVPNAHVLLRHRLLHQPRGFEGFFLARVKPKPPQLALTQRPHVRLALLDGYSASLSPKHRDHVVPGVDPLLDLRPPRIEGGYPLTKIVSDAVQAAIDAIVEHIADFDFWVVEAENRLVVAPRDASQAVSKS